MTSAISRLGPARTDPVRWMVILAVAFVIGIGAVTYAAVGHFRDRALRNSQRELENTVALLARHIDQELEDHRQVTTGLVSTIQTASVSTEADFKTFFSTKEANALLRNRTSNLSFGSLAVLASSGDLLNWSGSWPIPTVSFADRDYFRRITASPDPGLQVVAITTSRLTAREKLLFVRKVSGTDDRLLGAFITAIDTGQVKDYFASVSLSADVTLSMRRDDGTLVVSYPHGTTAPPAPAHASPLEEAGATARDAVSQDATDRPVLSVSRRLRDFPLSIEATAALGTALAEWRTQTIFLIGIAVALVAIIAGALLLVVRHLARQKDQLNTAVNNMTQGLLLFDADRRVVVCNQRYLDLYGVSPDIVKPGATLRDVIAHRKELGSIVGDVDTFCARILRDLPKGKPFIVEMTDGRSIQILDRPMAAGGWVSTHEDITERRQLDRQIARLAHYDVLTDLPNRALFIERLEFETKKTQSGEKFALLFIDLDEFKSVNDTLGHAAGDALLQVVAIRLKSCVRERDLVARLGGDEFAIVRPDVSGPGELSDLADRIYRAFADPYHYMGRQLPIEASIGIALAPKDGARTEELLTNADMAMYRAKADGRRTYRFFEPAMDERVKAHTMLETDLRRAVAERDKPNGEFAVIYQPIVDLRGGGVAGCEARLLWRHPQHGMIPSAEFLPMAEEMGLIDELGDWVLRTACSEAAQWPHHVRIAVNVSPVQFRNSALVLKIFSALAVSGLSADRLELEITEAALFSEVDQVSDTLQQLQQAGIRIVLDSFGTGYSSLSCLQRFRFDKLKIDRSLVSDIEGSANIIRAIVSIADHMEMTVTAEGAETETQRERLERMGCTEIQGDLFGKPVPAEDIRATLTAEQRPAIFA